MWSCPWSYSNYLNGFSAWNWFELKHPPVLPTGHIQFATSNETVNVPLSSFRVTIRDGVRHWSDAHRHVCHTDAMTVSHGQERVLNDVEDPVFMKQPTGQVRMESPYICLILFSFSLFALKGQKKYSFFVYMLPPWPLCIIWSLTLIEELKSVLKHQVLASHPLLSCWAGRHNLIHLWNPPDLCSLTKPFMRSIFWMKCFHENPKRSLNKVLTCRPTLRKNVWNSYYVTHLQSPTLKKKCQELIQLVPQSRKNVWNSFCMTQLQVTHSNRPLLTFKLTV